MKKHWHPDYAVFILIMLNIAERRECINMMGIIIVILIFVITLLAIALFGRDKRGFDRKGIHKNGTKFDDFGYDITGYDKNGYNRNGYDRQGYDKSGFNIYGYKIDGRNANGKYNRLYDKQSYNKDRYNREGFLDPQIYPVSLSVHARERIYERYPNGENVNADKLVREAYAYGKSSFQVMRTSSVFLKDIETRYENGTALLYNGYIFIFSEDNKLITMYKNEKTFI